MNRNSDFGRQKRTGRSRPAQSTPGSGCANPYVFYGAIAFLPAIALTLILVHVSPPDWDWLFLWLVVINVVTFFVYGYDKIISPSNTLRVPELILLLEVLLGAFIGAPIARKMFRHKTQKLSFRIRFWVAEIVSITWVALYYLNGYLAL
jgi:uncharacterized membrane protein YsdA (DUF1294 family)